MPGNQQNSLSPSHSVPTTSAKCPLVRSKSLRLPTTRPRVEQSPSTLTRHGSIRQIKAQSSNPAISKQHSVPGARKPLIKPKPVFTSKSTENLVRTGADGETRRQFVTAKTLPRNIEGSHCSKGVTFQNDIYGGIADLSSSLPNDMCQSSRDTSWCMPDLAVHLKRLTEEHEKLQVEYARLRMQLLDSATFQPIAALRRDSLQHLSHSDSHLASIPENSSESDKIERGPSYEALAHTFRAEIMRLQEENRKLQRKYWEQVLNSESIHDETNGGASQQVVELIDKLDDKERELLQVTGHVQELENHLAAATLELRQCHDAILNYQHMLEESNYRKEQFEKMWKDAAASLSQSRETVEFLQEERTALAEAVQELEQSFAFHKNEQKQSDIKLNELMTRARKLYAKVQDKKSQLQMLQAELSRTQGQARDMLLSQGAELTMMSMHLSELSSTLHNIVTNASEFAANELELQKEMLEDILADLDSDNEPSSLDLLPIHKAPSVDNITMDSFHHIQNPDPYTSLPNLPIVDAVVHPVNLNLNNESKQSASIVQSILCAVNQSAVKKGILASFETTVSDDHSPLLRTQSSEESLSSTCASESSPVKPAKSSAFRPVGTAIPFRPVSQSQRDVRPVVPLDQSTITDEEIKKASLEDELNQLKVLLGKVSKVFELTKEKFSSKRAALNEEVSQYQKELKLSKEAHKGLQSELKLKAKQIEKMSAELIETSHKLQCIQKANCEEKEGLLKQISELKEKNKCLEAVNKEQSRQLKEEIQLIESAMKKQNSVYFSDAVSICDKLNLKQEIAKLKEAIAHKEQMLQALAHKFEKMKKVLQENIQNADSEVECLDKVIQQIYESLQSNLQLVESSEVLQFIFSLVSGSVAIDEGKRKSLKNNCE